MAEDTGNELSSIVNALGDPAVITSGDLRVLALNAPASRVAPGLRTGAGLAMGIRAPEMLEDPHFVAREAIVTVDHPQFGKLRMQNVAPRLSETPGGVRSPSPALGQHNEDVYLRLLGIPRDRYERLAGMKVI